MSQASTFLGKIGGMFRRHREPVMRQLPARTSDESQRTERPAAPSAAAVAELMRSIKDGLDSSAQRQAEMIALLRQLPDTLRQIPETARLQSQAIERLGEQIRQQQETQARIVEALENLGQTSERSQTAMTLVGERLDAMRETDGQMVATLQQVGTTLSDINSVGTKNLQSSEAIREAILRREEQLDRIIKNRQSWIAALVIVALLMSGLAFAGLIVMAVTR